MAWELIFAHLGILLGIPLAVLADRVGRKPLILLYLLGFFLNDSWVKIVCM